MVLLGEMAVTGMVNNDDPAHDLPMNRVGILEYDLRSLHASMNP